MLPIFRLILLYFYEREGFLTALPGNGIWMTAFSTLNTDPAVPASSTAGVPWCLLSVTGNLALSRLL